MKKTTCTLYGGRSHTMCTLAFSFIPQGKAMCTSVFSFIPQGKEKKSTINYQII